MHRTSSSPSAAKLAVRASAFALLAVATLGTGIAGCEPRGGAPVAVKAKPPAPPRPRLSVASGAEGLSRITNDPIDEVSPVVSPDGNTLLLTAISYDASQNVASQVLVGVNPSGASSRTFFTSSKYIARGASWLPDGSGLAFVSNAMGAFHLVRTLSKTPNAAISIVVRADMAPDADRAAVSPDGKQVAFEMGRGGVKYVGVSGIDGTNFTQLAEGRGPSFSGDGRKIAFVRRVNDRDQIFTVNAQNGGDLTQITNDEADNRAPRWSTNGRYLVFASNRGWQRFQDFGASAQATWNIYAIRVDGTQLTQLTDGPSAQVQPYWSHDNFVYFASNEAANYDIWRVKPIGDLTAP